MENFRKAMYAACRQMDLEFVPMDTGTRVMAWIGLQGGDERASLSPRLKCELEHLQELYHIKGGEVPDKDFVLLIQKYTKELKDYTDTHNVKSGGWSAWVVYGRVYSIMDRTISESFKNVIFNYRYPNAFDAQTSSELDGKWKY